jgi:hypothetical protein
MVGLMTGAGTAIEIAAFDAARLPAVPDDAIRG